jgi:hypothetical protein
VPDELLALAADREPVVVLTAPWHERDTQSLVERLVAPVFTPPPDSADDLVRKYGITPEQAGDGSPDLAWLKVGEGEAHWYAGGDRLPVGIEAFPGGSTVEWMPKGVTHDDVAKGLRPLLALPVEFVLPAHGADGPCCSRARSPEARPGLRSDPSYVAVDLIERAANAGGRRRPRGPFVRDRRTLLAESKGAVSGVHFRGTRCAHIHPA